MNLSELGLGWREALLGVIVLLGCYIVFSMVRLRRLQERQAAPEPSPHGAVRPASAEPAPEQSAMPPAANEAGEAEEAEPPPHWYEPPDPFPGQERVEALERQVALLREQIDRLCDEIESQREETRQQVAQVQAAQHVSPIYGEAMQMAMAGYPAEEIATHCGIARAEAELVAALARNREEEA